MEVHTMIIAFTGAGISVESGIPTFQRNPDIREKLTRDFANEHPEEYRAIMEDFVNKAENAQPNDSHYALAEYNIPVITMNIDGLHQKAGSKEVLPIHGRLPTREELSYCEFLTEAPVLYGDLAPNYYLALDWLERLRLGDTLLVIGASEYTNIALAIREEARARGASIFEIQDNAGTKVRQFLERRKNEVLSYYSN